MGVIIGLVGIAVGVSGLIGGTAIARKKRYTSSQSTVVLWMDEVLAHYACTFKNSDLHFHFQ